MMMNLLSTLLLLLTSAIAVHSAPPPSTTTKKFIRRRDLEEGKPLSNDDPVDVKFKFTLQSQSQSLIDPSYNSQQRVANALASFGTTLFETSDMYGPVFRLFKVDTIAPTDVMAVSRGNWRQLLLRRSRRRLEEEQEQHSSSFEAKLTLESMLIDSDVDEEEIKGFFLNAMNEAAAGTTALDYLDSSLGEWSAVEYVAIATDAVVVPVEAPATTTTTVVTEVTPPTTTTTTTTPGETTNVVAIPSASDSSTTNTNPTTTETVVAKSPTTTNNSDGGEINGGVIGIVLGVVGACLIVFLVAVFAVRHNKRGGNNRRTSLWQDNIGDVHVVEYGDETNNKSTFTVGMWAAGLLPNAIRGKNNNNDTNGAFPTGTPVEVNEIDKVLADMQNSDDSSFVSDSSAADDTSCYSGYSGLTGISDLNYQPKNNNENETDESSKLAKVEEMKPSISFLDQTKGSQLSLTRESSLRGTAQSMRKEESFESDPSDPSKESSKGTSQSMRKEESFESDYRDKSAMATLNLKKDMLNADVGKDDKARTLSAQQNTEMMQQQRQVEKVRAASVKAEKMKRRMMKSVSPPRKDSVRRALSPTRKVEVEPDESRDKLLPSPVEKSDDSSSDDSNSLQIV